MNRTIHDLLEFTEEVKQWEKFVKIFPEDGHEPDEAGFNLHPRIVGKRLDNDGCKDNKHLIIKTDDEVFKINLTDILAFAAHGFKSLTQ